MSQFYSDAMIIDAMLERAARLALATPSDPTSRRISVADYTVDQNCLAEYFYRVHYCDNQTRFMNNGLHVAKYCDTYFDVSAVDEDIFRGFVERSFDWENRIPSVFINLFSKQEEAERWAMNLKRKSQSVHFVVKIDAQRLAQHRNVFKLSRLVNDLGVCIDGPGRRHIPHAYICLDIIDMAFIMSMEGTLAFTARRNEHEQIRRDAFQAGYDEREETSKEETKRDFTAIMHVIQKHARVIKTENRGASFSQNIFNSLRYLKRGFENVAFEVLNLEPVRSLGD